MLTIVSPSRFFFVLFTQAPTPQSSSVIFTQISSRLFGSFLGWNIGSLTLLSLIDSRLNDVLINFPFSHVISRVYLSIVLSSFCSSLSRYFQLIDSHFPSIFLFCLLLPPPLFSEHDLIIGPLMSYDDGVIRRQRKIDSSHHLLFIEFCDERWCARRPFRPWRYIFVTSSFIPTHANWIL